MKEEIIELAFEQIGTFNMVEGKKYTILQFDVDGTISTIEFIFLEKKMVNPTSFLLKFNLNNDPLTYTFMFANSYFTLFDGWVLPTDKYRPSGGIYNYRRNGDLYDYKLYEELISSIPEKPIYNKQLPREILNSI